MPGPTSIANIDREDFAATLQLGSDERRAFETLFIHGGTLNQNRPGDRELLRKLKQRDMAGGKPGLLARALTQFGVS